MEVHLILMSTPEEEKEDEVSTVLPAKTEEEEEKEDEGGLLTGVSSEDCRPTGEREEKEDESAIQSKEEKEDTATPAAVAKLNEGERFLAENLPGNHQRTEDKEGGEEVNSGSKKSSEAETILAMLLDGGRYIHELFLDQYQTPYAAIKVNSHIETISMRTKASSQFKNWICHVSYKELGTIPKDENINSVLNVLRADASYGENNKVRNLYLRAGPGDNSYEILYDLTNKDWEFVRITPEGWSIEKSNTTPVFKRHRNQLAQVYPSKEYPTDIFDQFMRLLNVKDENAILLLKVYIILLVYDKIQKPILAPYGEQGSAKSTLHEYILVQLEH
jgi:hypothetical protein